MSIWAFRFLLWFIVVLFVQPQNRFGFLIPLHLADIMAMGAVAMHVFSAAEEGRPIVRPGPGTILTLVILFSGLLSQYVGKFMTSTAWNPAIDVHVKACVIAILIEAMATSVRRVWAVQGTVFLCLLWWVKGGMRLSAAGATHSGDRIMGAAVSMIENPNAFAYFMACYIPLFFYFYRRSTHKYWRIFFLSMVVCGVFIVFQTGSRTGFLTVLAMVVLIVPTLAKQERKVLIFGAITVYFLMGFVSKGNIERFKTITYSINTFLLGDTKKAENPDEFSAQERYFRNKHTWNLILMNPLGVGMFPDPSQYPDEVSFASGQAHCEILMAGRATGFPGMIMYICVLGIPCVYGRRFWKRYPDRPAISDLGWFFGIQALLFAVGGAFSPTPFNYPQMIMLSSASAMIMNMRELGNSRV